MSQSCFTSEVYALYAIGSLDGEELSEFESHTGRGCEVCRAELDQARLFWSAYAAAVPPAAPRPELKQKVLAAVAPSRLRTVPKQTMSWWMQAAAAVLILSAGVGVGWRIHRPPVPESPRAQEAALTTPASAQDEITNLQAKIDQLNAKVADREKELQAIAGRTVTGPDLEKSVAALQAEAGQRTQLLQEAQSRATQLASELQRMRDQAAAADTRAREAGERYQTAANERKQALDRESRLRADYAARIRALETENEKFQRVIADQQRRIDKNTQLASFFASPNLRFYQYKGTRSGQAATAHVIVQEGSRALFYAFHMPQLAPGRTYQLWLIRGQSPAVVSGGIFRGDQDGNAVVEFANPALTRDVRQFAVTDEPASGSPGPTGNQYFRAS